MLENTIVSTQSHHLLKQIARKVQAGELVFFIGAGVSKSVYFGYPTGEELKKALLEELPHRKTVKEISLQHVAQAYEDECSRPELERFIAERVPSGLRISHLHQIISLFPVDVITTNYDSLVEDNFEKVYGKGQCNLIVEEADIVFTKLGRNIIKIHGSFSLHDRPRRITITEKDYNQYSRKNLLTVAYLKVILSKSILFLGYSMKDDDFLEIFQFVRDYLGVSAAQCYVIIRPSNQPQLNTPADKHIHIIYDKLDDFIRNLFHKVFFQQPEQSSPSLLLHKQGRDTKIARTHHKELLLEYLKKDQFDSGLWGKSIKQLFLKCFNRKKVPDEYRGIGSFSATDIVLRDLLVPNGATQLWKKDELLKTIRKQRDSFGGVGLNERIDINKFSIGQLKIDSNIRHTSAVVNISLLLEKHVDAMLSLNWLYQVENHWVDSNDGKMPINIACLIDCIDHARRNPGFANHCYCNPVEFRYIKEGFMCWEKKRNDLYRILNSSLLGERLWALRDSKGNLIENTMIYITLFILLRLENYPSLFPKKFTQIVWALYKLRTGHGLPFSLGSRKTIDVGATGTFLKIVFGEKAQEVLRSELTVNEFAELSDWLSASHKALFEKYLTRDSLTKSFAEIVSPILFLMRQ